MAAAKRFEHLSSDGCTVPGAPRWECGCQSCRSEFGGPCSDGCSGWFRNSESLRIERCDACARFPDDVAAEDFVRANGLGAESVTRFIPGRRQRGHCLDCREAFETSGPAGRSSADSELCSYCYVNG